MKLVVEEEIPKSTVETFSVDMQLTCRKKKFFKKKMYSLKVEIEHIKRKNYNINKRNEHINEEFSDSEEETM